MAADAEEPSLQPTNQLVSAAQNASTIVRTSDQACRPTSQQAKKPTASRPCEYDEMSAGPEAASKCTRRNT